MKLLIPELTTQIQLTKNWEFPLHFEKRNYDMLEIKMPGAYQIFKDAETLYYSLYYKRDESKELEKEFIESHEFLKKIRKNCPIIIIKSGEILEIDRIYIRKGADDFSSVTFKWQTNVCGKKRILRFWTKLEDVNNIEFEPAGKNIRWPNGKFGLLRFTPYKGNSIIYDASFDSPNFKYIRERFEIYGQTIERKYSWGA